jgi:hypothetical protein
VLVIGILGLHTLKSFLTARQTVAGKESAKTSRYERYRSRTDKELRVGKEHPVLKRGVMHRPAKKIRLRSMHENLVQDHLHLP